MIDHKKGIKLARYGGLSPVKQTHYTTDYDNMTYHGAPEKYGIYAFLYPYIDWFLLGGDTGKIKKKTEGLKNKRSVLNAPYKKFSVEGDIWTHIEPQGALFTLVKETRGSWFRISASDFPKIFTKEYSSLIKEYHALVPNRHYTVKSPFKLYGTDYLEIFVPKASKIINF